MTDEAGDGGHTVEQRQQFDQALGEAAR